MDVGGPLLFPPPLFWFGVALHLLPEGSELPARLDHIWKNGWLVAAASLYELSTGTDLDFDITAGAFQLRPSYFLFSVVVLVPLLVALFFCGGPLSGPSAATDCYAPLNRSCSI
jgi:hypothetical protein